MVDTLVLGTNVERRESSNLSLVTDMVRTIQCVKIGSAKLGYSLVAMTADCKSALFRVRRFESVYPNNMPEWRQAGVYNPETRCILEGAETEMDCV